jgi:hypothetical protein
MQAADVTEATQEVPVAGRSGVDGQAASWDSALSSSRGRWRSGRLRPIRGLSGRPPRISDGTPEEGSEQVGRARSAGCLRGRPEQRHPVSPAVRVSNREPGPGQQFAGQLRI